jgi:DNA ligase D-like protein (predicted ligase)
MFSTVIQRPGHASHAVEERYDSRKGDGSTYLWCDCGAWKFQVSKGGCAHVKLAREQQAAGVRVMPMTPEQKATREAFESAAHEARLGTSTVTFRKALDLPIAPMLAAKTPSPRGRVTEGGVEMSDLNGASVAVHWPVLLRQDLAYEPKWDGNRMMAECHAGNVRLWARSGRMANDSWPEIAEAFRWSEGVFDGEVITLDPTGRHTFNSLQNSGRLSREERQQRVRFVVWDLLEANGEVTMHLPYEDRRRMLEDAKRAELGPFVPDAANRILLTPMNRDGVALWNVVIDQHLEGVIAKPLRSTYKPGERGTWLKIKTWARAELVIVGWMTGLSETTGTTTAFGNLVVADRKDGQLVYAGKVGTGFNDGNVAELLRELAPLRSEAAPVAWNAGVMTKMRTNTAGRTLTWVRPELTALVEFADRSNEGIPRFPSYKGLVR